MRLTPSLGHQPQKGCKDVPRGSPMQRRIDIGVDLLGQPAWTSRTIAQRSHDLIDPRFAVRDLVIDHAHRILNRVSVAGVIHPILPPPHHRQ